jgi:hypothetical protein
VALHRLGRAGAIGVEQRVGHVVVLRERGGAAGGSGSSARFKAVQPS